MADSPKALAKEFYENLYNDLDGNWERYLSTDLVNHAMGGTTREAWLAAEKGVLAAFPDFSATVLDQVAEGDKVVTRVSITGTQVDEYYGIPSNGAQATLTATLVDRFEGDKIVEHWAEMDFGGFMQQLSGGQ